MVLTQNQVWFGHNNLCDISPYNFLTSNPTQEIDPKNFIQIVKIEPSNPGSNRNFYLIERELRPVLEFVQKLTLFQLQPKNPYNRSLKNPNYVTFQLNSHYNGAKKEYDLLFV